MLDKSLVVVNESIPVLDNDPDPPVNEGGIRLFRHAPPGIIFDPIDERQPRKRPRILPGGEVDEKSKKFRHQLKSVAVDGIDIMAAARDACQKSLARFVAKDAAAKAAAKREEERVAELKKIRGEKWLPSIAREMRGVTGKEVRRESFYKEFASDQLRVARIVDIHGMLAILYPLMQWPHLSSVFSSYMVSEYLHLYWKERRI
ncbi:hypothetical protein BVC80_8915g31 [Macleaya cordata]|uniref:Uncharacterized protein n=1 Tax=Macleaya cordata TaxID=56857 RepID=A0A200QFV3_MACCD|nr:hypothetical protein BVC80_8915g31 [Macleaya cordata]